MNDFQQTPIQINGLYRHFKGDYFIVNKIATQVPDGSQNSQVCQLVVYTSVTTNMTFAIPFEDFFADVSDTEGNTTHQVHRFELAQELKGLLSLTTTEELANELKNRPDNPYEGYKTLDEDEDVWSVQFLLGRVVTHPATDTEDEYEEFVPVTPAAFDSFESAKKYRETFYANRPCVIARRVTKKIKEF